MSAALKREIIISDINPKELAAIFCGMWAEEQAAFFDEIWFIAKEWQGAGWCQQSYDIAKLLGSDGRNTVTTLAGHVIGEDLTA